MINGYSAILGTALYPLTSLVDDAHGNRITAPTVYRKISMNCVTVVTWNRPLYNPKPEPIASTYKLLKDNAALKSKIIEVIRVNKVGVIDEEYSGIAINNEVSPIKSIYIINSYSSDKIYEQRESNPYILLGR